MTTEAVTDPIPTQDPKPTATEKEDANKLSEEDQRIKDQVELLVIRAADRSVEVSKLAVEQLVDLLRTSSSLSVASVPKPLKYVRSMYPQLELALKATSDETLAKRLHDVLSFIAMTLKFSVPRVSLDHKLKGTTDDLALWGHEYLRFLAGHVGEEWKERVSKSESTDYLNTFVDQIVEFMVLHQDDPSAIDLLVEIDDISRLTKHVEESNYKRVASYLEAIRKYLTRPSDTKVVQTAFNIYVMMKNYSAAASVGIQLSDGRERLIELVEKCTDREAQIQLALQCARYKVFLPTENEEDEIVADANGNARLSQIFRSVGKELDAVKVKSLEELFKSASNNAPIVHDLHYSLSCAFGSALANCAFGEDAFLSGDNDDKIQFDHRQDRIISTVAAQGLLYLWDYQVGIQVMNNLLESSSNFIKAGAALGTGIILCGIHLSSYDIASALLLPFVLSPIKDIQIGAILGLGYACAGTNSESAKETLIPILADSNSSLEVHCMTAYALATVFVGSADEDITETMINCLLEIPEERLTDAVVRYLILALGCMFLGCQESADTLIDTCGALPFVIRRYTEIVIQSCAFAGTGNVVVIQKFFHTIAENEKPQDPSKEEEGESEEKGAKPYNINFKTAAALGIGMVALGEPMGTEMTKRSIIHMLLTDTVSHEGHEMSGRRSVPLVFALLSASDPQITVIEHLNRLAHDSDIPTAQNAILALGIIAAGSNNARVTSRLSSLAAYYNKPDQVNVLFTVRLAQGLCAMGRGHLTLSPLHYDRSAVSPTALMGLLGLMHSAFELDKTLLEGYHYMFYALTPSISPRMVVPVDTELEVISGVQVRVGAPADTVAVPGKPRAITGFQTQKTPVLLGGQEKVEVADDNYTSVAAVIEGIIVLKKKPSVN